LAFSLKIMVGADTRLGPGKAELLRGIQETGSIAAAGRRMNMSYKRAWQLISTLNACFAEPVVTTTRGGTAHGGAVLTATGQAVLDGYCRMLGATERTIGEEVTRIEALTKAKAVAPADPSD
jgi:molybdate transport system regulatory protein